MVILPENVTYRHDQHSQVVTPATAPPPLGDLSTRHLIAAIIAAGQGQPTTRRLDLGRRGVSLDEARAELRRRSAVGRG